MLFTDFFDDWSRDDFAKFVYNQQYVIVDPEYETERPLRAADDLAPTLADAKGVRILDFGSGSGAFAAELRARGFRFVQAYDPISRPEPPSGRFDIITCIDVIEHSTDPARTFQEILGYLENGGCVLVGQTLQPPDIAALREGWWYLAPRNGHVTTFSSETLHQYAAANGLRFDDFGDLFALTRETRTALTESIVRRRAPKQRRLVLGSPGEAPERFEAWHDLEDSPSGRFRWTRSSEVHLGAFPTPSGDFRVILEHLGKITPEHLAASSIRVGPFERPILVHEDTLYAVFDLPEPAIREISIRTPPPVSEKSLGVGTETRAVGLAIRCVDDIAGSAARNLGQFNGARPARVA